MFNKKFLLLCLVFVVCSFLVVGCGLPKQPAALTIDDLDMVNAYVAGDAFAAANDDQHWGPWDGDPTQGTDSGWSFSEGALVFDCSHAGAYVTMNWKDDLMATDAYQYAVISMKVDSTANADDALGAQMTFGDKDHVTLDNWGISGLTTSYKTFIIDLPAKGFTSWGTPDFAMNQNIATTAKIYIDYIKLANKK